MLHAADSPAPRMCSVSTNTSPPGALAQGRFLGRWCGVQGLGMGALSPYLHGVLSPLLWWASCGAQAPTAAQERRRM